MGGGRAFFSEFPFQENHSIEQRMKKQRRGGKKIERRFMGNQILTHIFSSISSKISFIIRLDWVYQIKLRSESL